MLSPSELTLHCKPQSYSMLLKSLADQPDQPRLQKLEEYLARLEEERLKIDAFKRELPLCMQLLTNALEVSRQQLQSYRTNKDEHPMLEEFIPLKKSNTKGSDQKPGNNSTDKASWMTSAQLWSQSGEGNMNQECPKEAAVNGFHVSSKLRLDMNQRNGGAFLPFRKERNSSTMTQVLPDLALASGEDLREVEDKRSSEVENGMNGLSSDSPSKAGSGLSAKPSDVQTTATTTMDTTGSGTTTTQAHRKARRCWSPDLHRRFVNALQRLGGSQVATPKQIRELMKVEGLTNDEVKSHLQKYRLHTRRPSQIPQATGVPAPQLVVLGGLWVPPEYATMQGGAPTIYTTSPASRIPTHYYPTSAPQGFYPTATAAPPHQNQLHQHQLHMYQTPCQTQGSPESKTRGGNGSESIEDGKTDSSSWKGDSGGEEGGEKKMIIDGDGKEESTGSEITLKF
ncbi:Myb family transcription factor EFM-like protein [Drosera capensis]